MVDFGDVAFCVEIVMEDLTRIYRDIRTVTQDLQPA